MGNFSALETLKRKKEKPNGTCLSCKNFYKEGNCEICLKTDKFIIPEFRPYNCKDWSNKMENADKMFEELGYENIINEMCVCEYIKYFRLKGARHIIFQIDKTISVCEENEKCLAVNRDWFSMQELQAINQKCKELQWI